MATTDICLNTICSQRLQQMAFTMAPTRYEGQVTPYPTFTQKQLDMRRKAEILQYGAAKTNTKTNNFTKAERYSTIIKGKGQKSSYATIYEPSFNIFYYATDTCGNETQVFADTSINVFGYTKKLADISNCLSRYDMVPTPTSSSGIPGPIQYLVRDVGVPLYNYATNTNPYSFDPTTYIPKWDFIPINNVFCSNTTETKIFTLGILESIDQPSYNFSFSTPFSIYFTCNCTSSTSVNLNALSVSITSLSATVYFSGSKASFINPTYNLTNDATSMIFDISINPQGQTIPITAQLYSGILTISNINLYTSPGFVYDINLNFNMNFSTGNNSTVALSNFTYGVICNLTQELSTKSINCTINTSRGMPSLTPYRKISVSGI